MDISFCQAKLDGSTYSSFYLLEKKPCTTFTHFLASLKMMIWAHLADKNIRAGDLGLTLGPKK